MHINSYRTGIPWQAYKWYTNSEVKDKEEIFLGEIFEIQITYRLHNFGGLEIVSAIISTVFQLHKSDQLSYK